MLQLAPSRFNRASLFLAIALFCLTGAYFALGRVTEAEFVDEWAYVSQAYFAQLLNKPDDPRWLEYPAFDLPPLPKYVIAFALQAGSHPIPQRPEMFRWYGDTSTRFGSHQMLADARWPSVFFGAFGCLALMMLGSVALNDRRVGLLAGLLLAINPLYAMHARRAMSDVPTETFTLLACALTLWAWTRGTDSPPRNHFLTWLALLGSGVSAGLAVLSKLSGGLAVLVLAGWLVLFSALSSSRRSQKQATAATLVAFLLSYAVFVALNPFLISSPPREPAFSSPGILKRGLLGRTLFLLEHRAAVSRRGQEMFPDDATRAATSKIAAVVAQGFGRFGPLGQKRPVPLQKRRDPERQLKDFDSTIRYDWKQDAGALVWLPLVLAGAGLLMTRGLDERDGGQPPAAWAILLQWAITLVTVTAFLPLAWDRYYLPLQAPSALLASAALVAAFDHLRQPRVVSSQESSPS